MIIMETYGVRIIAQHYSRNDVSTGSLLTVQMVSRQYVTVCRTARRCPAKLRGGRINMSIDTRVKYRYWCV